MAKKKKSNFVPKLTKKQKVRLRRVGLPVAVGLICLNIGIVGARYLEGHTQPANLVWAADATVQVPGSLKSLLYEQDGCNEYRGADSPKGVGLWGVYQVSKARFAKIAYGCSWGLSNYVMAVNHEGDWKLLPPAEYFAPFQDSRALGAVPFCRHIDQYRIDKSIEPFCIETDGSARPNTID